MNTSKLISLLVIFLSLSMVAMAQGPGGGGGGVGGTPIDGGISMLVGGIALYGAKKIRERRRLAA